MNWKDKLALWIDKRLDSSRNVCGFSPFQTGHDDPFHEACFWHDIGYWQKHLPRDEIDERFYAEVKKIIRESPWYKKPYRWAWGYAYIGLVKLFGKVVWGD